MSKIPYLDPLTVLTLTTKEVGLLKACVIETQKALRDEMSVVEIPNVNMQIDIMALYNKIHRAQQLAVSIAVCNPNPNQCGE